MSLSPARLVFCAALLYPAASLAAVWQVDVLIYNDREAQNGLLTELPAEVRAPQHPRLLDIEDEAELRGAGIRLLPEAQFGLQQQWSRLLNSKRFEPILQRSWLQQDPPASNGPALRIHFGAPIPLETTAGSYYGDQAAGLQQPRYFGDTAPAESSEPELVYTLDGSISLLLSRFLHLETDLAWTQADRDGVLGSYRLNESRRMRSGELHHLDSPRFGLLVQVRKTDYESLVPTFNTAPGNEPAPDTAGQ